MTQLTRRLSFNVASKNTSIDSTLRICIKKDQDARQAQREQYGYNQALEVDFHELLTDGEYQKDTKFKTCQLSKKRPIPTLAISTHANSENMGYYNEQGHCVKISARDILSKMLILLNNKKEKLPKEIILNMCYSYSHVEKFQDAIKELQLPVKFITYHDNRNVMYSGLHSSKQGYIQIDFDNPNKLLGSSMLITTKNIGSIDYPQWEQPFKKITM